MPPDAVSPEQLLAQARAQGGQSLGSLLELYRGYLTLLARLQLGRRLQGKADAADLVQETFLEAHQNWGRFRGTSEGEFLRWLRRILAAQIADLMRRFLGTRRRDVRLEARVGRRIGSLLGASRRRTAGEAGFAQPSGVAARTGCAVGEHARWASSGLSRSAYFTASGRTDFP